MNPGEPPAGPWQTVPLAGLVERLNVATARAPGSSPAVVAVDGRGGVGKTTLVDRLCALVPGSAVVHTDDVAWHHSIFDWTDLLVEGVLAPLRRGEGIRFRPPAWDARARVGAITVPGDVTVLWLEGTGSSRRELGRWLDAAIWIQADGREAERRMVRRDGDDDDVRKVRRAWIEAEIPFFIDQAPWRTATVIVHGSPDAQVSYDDVMVAAPVHVQDRADQSPETRTMPVS